ncbi:hypothetical protein BpJC4_23570 [Weizmannia acidilactici]|uniref:YppG family protein n=1 Tax=Weizmannia acidilactici TaxID=2607726 RepID=UPI00124E058F|nr:YppG family protein [Weizmannia acidilactici]GER67886.1 hypothetical protein BpJC4_23570 [Weizmannia acidilactici]
MRVFHEPHFRRPVMGNHIYPAQMPGLMPHYPLLPYQPQQHVYGYPLYPYHYGPFGGGYNQAAGPLHGQIQQNFGHDDGMHLFENPLQPNQQQKNGQQGGNSYMHPYPKHNFPQKPPHIGGSFLNSFKSQDGSIDFNKMVNTAGQMMNAVNQVSSMVKGLGGLFKK